MGIRTETFCRCFVYVSSVPVTADLPVNTSGSNPVRLTVSRRSDVAMLSRSARFDAALRDIEFHLIDSGSTRCDKDLPHFGRTFRVGRICELTELAFVRS